MSRKILTSGAAILAATSLSGALALSGAGTASAADSNRDSDSERSTTDGSGDADAHAKANDKGRLVTDADADGGEGGGPLGGSTPTTASARADVTQRVAVADGTYRIKITYQGLKGSERDRGDDSQAEAIRRSTVRFVSQTDDDDRNVTRQQQVPSKKGTKSTTLVIKVPNDSSGFLKVKALLRSTADANGNDSSAHAAARTSAVGIKVKRI